MTVGDIIKAVRLCIDEEAVNAANLADASAYDFDGGTHTDTGLMNNIIRNKIGDALRWVCLYAPAELLGGTDEEKEEEGQTVPVDTGVLVDYEPEATDITAISEGGGRFALPADFLKLARVRVEGWHRAVKVPFSESSDEYLQLYDENGATATDDRPQAALIDSAARKLEVWPWQTEKEVYVTYVADGDPVAIYSTEEGEEDTVIGYALPPKVKTAIIYYLAYLTLTAYGDTRADRMLAIAKMSLGITSND